MTVLGVDPSSTCTGFGVLECRGRSQIYLASGCIRTSAGLALEDRLVVMFQRMQEVVAAHTPGAAAVERTFVGRDPDAAAKLGHARGVLLLALRLAGVPVASYTPAEVKRAITGNGQAGKRQVQYMVTTLLGLAAPPRPLDASDAVAVALCHAFRPGALAVPDGKRPRRAEVDALLQRMIRR